MTKRITWIILLTVWATMIAAGVSAYFTTRAQMLAHLDHVMLDELMSDRKYPHNGTVYRTVGRTHKDDLTRMNAPPTRKYPHAEPIRKTWFRSPDSSERERSIVASGPRSTKSAPAASAIEALCMTSTWATSE